MDVISLWTAVFPEHKQRIQEGWKRMEPACKILRVFRDSAGFHADKPLKFFGARLEARTQFYAEVDAALQEFDTLFKLLLHAQGSELKKQPRPALDCLLE